MNEARCGLGVTAMADGKVFAVGGYGGNLTYLNSAEVTYFSPPPRKKKSMSGFVIFHRVFGLSAAGETVPSCFLYWSCFLFMYCLSKMGGRWVSLRGQSIVPSPYFCSWSSGMGGVPGTILPYLDGRWSHPPL